MRFFLVFLKDQDFPWIRTMQHESDAKVNSTCTWENADACVGGSVCVCVCRGDKGKEGVSFEVGAFLPPIPIFVIPMV